MHEQLAETVTAQDLYMSTNSDTEMNVGEASIKLLEAYGVDTVFGIPGVHTLEFCRGLNQSSIRHVQARNEQGAGHRLERAPKSRERFQRCQVTIAQRRHRCQTEIEKVAPSRRPLGRAEGKRARGDDLERTSRIGTPATRARSEKTALGQPR